VDILVAEAEIDGVRFEFVDTPGVYNLYPSSLEEEVTEKAILDGGYDFVINVVDATALERSLLITVALAELGVPMIVAVNFWEEAERKGIRVDTRRLEEALGVPVVKVNPLRRGGVDELVQRLGEAKRSKLTVRYDDHIERAVSEALECVPGDTRLSRRGLAVRLVEGDPLVCERYCCEAAVEARRRLIEAGHDPGLDIEAARAGVAARLAAEASRVEQATPPEISRLDMLLASHPLLGLLFALFTLASLVVAAVAAGGRVVGLLSSTVGPLVEEVAGALESSGGLLGLVAGYVVKALYAQYAAALPYVFVFYLLLTLLEDSGLLARSTIWLAWVTERLGVHPKAVIPGLLGLGCSVPAVRATRILPGPRQRLAAAAALAFIPCSSRSSVIFAVGAHVAGWWVPLLVYGQGFLLGLLAASMVARATRAVEEALLVEDVPPLRFPGLSNVLDKARARLEDFVVVVTPLVAAGAVAYAVLDYTGAAGAVAGVLRPVAGFLGLPVSALPAIVYGFIQKDLVVSMLAAGLGSVDFSAVLTPRQALVFTILNSYKVPCVIAFAVMVREFGLRRALVLLLVLDSIGFGIAALYAHLPLLLH
jgi:ferrous iron transport protein B